MSNSVVSKRFSYLRRFPSWLWSLVGHDGQQNGALVPLSGRSAWVVFVEEMPPAKLQELVLRDVLAVHADHVLYLVLQSRAASETIDEEAGAVCSFKTESTR